MRMIIKMVTKFKVCTPKPDTDLCMRVDLPPDKKIVENQDLATGPSWALGRGPWAVGRGPWAAEPLGRRGPWAARPRTCFWQNPC